MAAVVITLAVLIGMLLVYLRIWKRNTTKPDLDVTLKTSEELVPGDLKKNSNLQQKRHSTRRDPEAIESNFHSEKNQLLSFSSTQNGLP